MSTDTTTEIQQLKQRLAALEAGQEQSQTGLTSRPQIVHVRMPWQDEADAVNAAVRARPPGYQEPVLPEHRPQIVDGTPAFLREERAALEAARKAAGVP